MELLQAVKSGNEPVSGEKPLYFGGKGCIGCAYSRELDQLAVALRVVWSNNGFIGVGLRALADRGRIGFDRIGRSAGGVSWLIRGPRKNLITNFTCQRKFGSGCLRKTVAPDDRFCWRALKSGHQFQIAESHVEHAFG